VNHNRIGEKWEDEYLCRIALVDHCREIIALHEHAAVYKAAGSTAKAKRTGEQFFYEAADLFLILEALFDRQYGPAIIEQRIARFAEKEREAENPEIDF
jgi:hypothetical protein